MPARTAARLDGVVLAAEAVRRQQFAGLQPVPLGVQLAADLGLTTQQRAFMVATPILSGAVLRLMLGLLADRTLSVPLAKEVLAEVVASGAAPAQVVEEKGLGQISDEGELVALVAKLFDDNPAQAEQLRGGKEKLLGFFVGQAMKATQGRADPGRVSALVKEHAGL